MANKKFSDFTSVNSLQDNEFLATELLGVENRKITFNDFANQIQSKLLQLSYSDIGCIKSSLVAPADNKQPNMIYCDGTTYYASNPNQLISKFINAVYPYVALRNFLQIPADKSSFKTPDLRNQHLVGVGSGNTAYQYITSKVMNFINGVSTTTNLDVKLSGGGSFRLTSDGSNDGAYLHNFVTTGNTDAIVYGSFQPGQAKLINFQNWTKTDNQYHQINFNFSKIGTSTSTAKSTTTLSYNNNIIDSINRVPALAVYHYIDIAVDRFNLDPNATGGGVLINISDVIGLQTALDSKADITLLNNYATTSALNTGLSGKANISHTHIIGDITGLQTALDGKANTAHTHLIGELKYDNTTSLENWIALTYAPINHTHNISGITGLQDKINIYDKKRIFSRSWTTTTAGTIIGNASVRILDRLAYTAVTGIEPLNNTFNYTSGTNSFIKELDDVDLPDKILKITLRIKNGGAMGNTQLEFSLFRQSDNTQVGGSDNAVINDPDTRGVSLKLPSRSYGANDPFVTGGYYVVLRNLTGTDLAYNNIELLIQVIRDIGY